MTQGRVFRDWLEDVGYPLWLRLYVETARRSEGALPLPIHPLAP